MPSNYDQPFQEALDYFTAKGYQLNPGGWAAIAQEANAGAFTVAKVAQMDILEDIKGALEQALNDGLTYQEFADNLIPTLEKKGWLGAASRLGVIFETNLAAAYSVGRWTQIQQIKDDRPYWQYRGIRDSVTRRTHLACFGKIFRIGDSTGIIVPPNGHRCRCYMVAVDQSYLDKNGLTVSTEIPMFKDVDGVLKQALPDIGFRYNVGEAGMNAWKPVIKTPEAMPTIPTTEVAKAKSDFSVVDRSMESSEYYQEMEDEAAKMAKGLKKKADKELRSSLEDNSRMWKLIRENDLNDVIEIQRGNKIISAVNYEVQGTNIKVEYLATNPENLVGKGVSGGGTRALSALAEKGLQTGVETITLDALPGATKFYEKLGFREIGFDEFEELKIFQLDKKGMEALVKKVGKLTPEVEIASEAATAARVEKISDVVADVVAATDKKFVVNAVAESGKAYTELSDKAYDIFKAGNYENTVLRQNSDMWRQISSVSKDPNMLIKNTYTASGELSSSAAWNVKNGKTAYVEFLATNPNNIVGAGVSGSGTTTLASIAEEALAQGLKEIKLTSLDSAMGFYEKIGFKQVGKSSVMKMNEKAMKTFVESVKSKGYFSECLT